MALSYLPCRNHGALPRERFRPLAQSGRSLYAAVTYGRPQLKKSLAAISPLSVF